MNVTCLMLMSVLACTGVAKKESPIDAKLVLVTKIWDNDPHSAFTDLVRWKGKFVCVFRAGARHVSPDGAIQLLASVDGSSWRPLARIKSDSADLRDPKLAIGSDNQLIVYAAGAMHDKSVCTHRTYQWTSTDGKAWSDATEVGEPDSWLWRVTPHSSGYYGWGYGTNKERFIRFYRSKDGKSGFEPITPKVLQPKGYVNETGMVMEGDLAWCLLRRDGKAPQNTGLLGMARAPFTDWTWQDLGVQIGGPALMRLPSGQFLAVVRLYNAPRVRTALCSLDIEKAKLTELITLPSSGDSSYAGMVWHEQKLWISYYSSHEGKTSIYFAEVDVKQE